jgi:hypothetical protein
MLRRRQKPKQSLPPGKDRLGAGSMVDMAEN